MKVGRWVDAKSLVVGDHITFTNIIIEKYIMEIVAIKEVDLYNRRKYSFRYIGSDDIFHITQHNNLRVFLIEEVDDKYSTLEWLWEGENK